MIAKILALCLMAASCFGEGPYVTSELWGQFGNQMFAMATATSLALDNGAEAVFPDLATNNNFAIPENYAHVFYHINAAPLTEPISYVYNEPHYHYSPIPYHPNMVIRGWFQSEKYFLNHKQEIIDLFSPHPEIVAYLENKYPNIVHNPKTVSIHYRYYMEDPNHDVYAKCDLDYYQKAIALFPEDTLFVVFSNQIDWCKENFAHIPRDFYFVEGEPHYHDFYLMSLCQHNIIGNSTFSWWAAYLNRNPGRLVIVPPQWFNPWYGANDKDLIPPEWTILR